MEPITWNGEVHENYDLIHAQMYERILQLERILKAKSEKLAIERQTYTDMCETYEHAIEVKKLRLEKLDKENRLLRVFIAVRMVMFQSEIDDALVELEGGLPEMNRILNE